MASSVVAILRADESGDSGHPGNLTYRQIPWRTTSPTSSSTPSTRWPIERSSSSATQRRTYAQLEARANQLAHHLIAQGIGPGDHVGVYGANSVEWIEAALAAYKVRAVPVNVNFRYVEEELRYLFDNADFKAVVYDRSSRPRIRAVRDSLPLLQHLIHIDDGIAGRRRRRPGRARARSTSRTPWRRARPSATSASAAATTTTSSTPGGTTGMPKGVVWRQEDVFYALGGGIDAYTNERVAVGVVAGREGQGGRETPMRSLNLPPLMHGAAQWGFLRFAFEGNFVVMLRKFDPHEVWRTVEREGINNLRITGDAMARPMIEALEEMGGPDALDLSSLFVLASTAAIFSPTVKDQYLELFPNLMIIDAIGSRRRAPTACAWSPRATRRTRAAAPPCTAGRDSVVLDEDLNEIEPGTGVQGRLARRGNVPLEYYKDPEKSAATFVTGPTAMRYALAGDMAIHEADGTITLLGRGSQCINSGGEKIFPEEVEAALKAHPAVFDAIVVGVPDERWGQRVAAVVQPRDGDAPTLDDLDAHCRELRRRATRCPRSSTSCPRWSAPPAASPTTRGPARSPAARSPSEPPIHTKETSMQVHEKLFIGGEWVDPAGTDVIEVISPHTEEVVGRVPEGTTADIDRAVAGRPHRVRRGRVAADGARGAHRRRRSGSPSIYAARMMDMAQVITTEMGSPDQLLASWPSRRRRG